MFCFQIFQRCFAENVPVDEMDDNNLRIVFDNLVMALTTSLLVVVIE